MTAAAGTSLHRRGMLARVEKAGRGFRRVALLFVIALVAYFSANEIQRIVAPGAGFPGHMAVYLGLLTLGLAAALLVSRLRSKGRG